jgi:2-polyprenyl-3-methyl-5-hydroxy-6-metoxy-1,4-benzoquinol methylase
MCSDVLGKIDQSNVLKLAPQQEPIIVETPATLPVMSVAPAIQLSEECARFKTMLNSEAWPNAVAKELICDDNNEQDKFDRATGIVNVFISELVENKKFLDFGCGFGHVPFSAHINKAKVSVGYDISDNFSVNEQQNLVLTNNWQKVIDNGPYDIITMFDVMDHLIDETPVNVLLNLKTVLSPNGKLYVRYHPFISRHGSHLYKKINKAYLHLVFTPEEIKAMIPDYVPESSPPVVQPLKIYSTIPVLSGLKIEKEYITRTPVENFFKHGEIAKRIVENTGMPMFSEQDLCIEFIDHCYSMVDKK